MPLREPVVFKSDTNGLAVAAVVGAGVLVTGTVLYTNPSIVSVEVEGVYTMTVIPAKTSSKSWLRPVEKLLATSAIVIGYGAIVAAPFLLAKFAGI